jgi:hypothetical protein
MPASIITPSTVETERLGTLNLFGIRVLHAGRAGDGCRLADTQAAVAFS